MSLAKILVVDDEKEIADLFRLNLTAEGYEVFTAYDAASGFKILESKDIDLVLLDIMMPGMDGLTMCSRIRQVSNIPIIIVSAKTEQNDKIIGLSMGADDYVTKPFTPAEVLARVHSQLRRYQVLNPAMQNKQDRSVIQVGDVEINKEERRVSVNGEFIRLTPIEFDILVLLASHPGKVFTTQEIFERVWHETFYEADNTVMVHIRRLRSKIHEEKRERKLISTVWGVGYKIEG